MKHGSGKQRGVTLLISLIMLVVLTLFAVTMIRLSNTNVVVVGNMQTQRYLAAAAQQAIETDLNSAAFYNDVPTSTSPGSGCWANGVTTNTFGSTGSTPCFPGASTNSYQVKLTMPTCINTQIAPGYSAIANITLYDDYYEVTATATDPTDTNAGNVTIVQGVRVILPAKCN
jgi:Tfp pilus assembly protein PilX